ncbi:hypothetical protein OSTOST_18307, partial [Ostertagia ostertagi]
TCNDLTSRLGALLLDSDDESASDDGDSEDKENAVPDDPDWSFRVDSLSPFIFEPPPISPLDDMDVGPPIRPVEFYRLFLNDRLVNAILLETNRYGLTGSSSFGEVGYDEFMKFMGVCMYMGIVKLPTLRSYWSSRRIYGGTPLCRSIMTRSRFEAILGNLHFCNNDEKDVGDRLFKIRMILDSFNDTASTVCIPGKCLTIDESIVPFRGRLYFKQYIPNKKHKFGIKVFKLCCEGGYTSKVEVYCGKLNDKCGSVAEAVVMRLMNGYLDCGRKLYCDNWYSSVPLTRKLLNHYTDFVGTFRKNRKGFPKAVTQRKLKRGEIIACQHKDGITVIQWRDKRPVFCMSTCHGDDLDKIGPDERHNPFVRRTSKWYVRFFFHMMLQTSIVNAWVLYNKRVAKMPSLEFQTQIAESLLGLEVSQSDIASGTQKVLEKVEGPLAATRKNCSGCYKRLALTIGRDLARKKVKRVNTQCSRCKKYICLDCYNVSHL